MNLNIKISENFYNRRIGVILDNEHRRSLNTPTKNTTKMGPWSDAPEKPAIVSQMFITEKRTASNMKCGVVDVIGSRSYDSCILNRLRSSCNAE